MNDTALSGFEAERIREESLCPQLPGQGEPLTDPAACEILEVLTALGIPYRYVKHPPVKTMDDCVLPAKTLGALMPKNIFLTPRNGSSYWLLITRPEARYRTASVSKQLGVARLSFAPEEKLFEYLQTTPGAVTPLGLIYDEGHAVHLAVDSSLRDTPVLAFHPCTGSVSLALSGSDFFGRFLPALGVEPVFVTIDETEESE